MRHAPNASIACMAGYSCCQAGCSRITPTTTCAEQPSSSIGRAWQHLSRARTSTCRLPCVETMEATAVIATPATRPRRAREGSAPMRPVVVPSWPPPRVVSSSVARRVAVGSARHAHAPARTASCAETMEATRR